MSAKTAVFIGFLLIGSAFFGVFLGTLGHENKNMVQSENPPKISENPPKISENPPKISDNPPKISENTKEIPPANQNPNSTYAPQNPNSSSKSLPSFQYRNETQVQSNNSSDTSENTTDILPAG